MLNWPHTVHVLMFSVFLISSCMWSILLKLLHFQFFLLFYKFNFSKWLSLTPLFLTSLFFILFCSNLAQGLLFKLDLVLESERKKMHSRQIFSLFTCLFASMQARAMFALLMCAHTQTSTPTPKKTLGDKHKEMLTLSLWCAHTHTHTCLKWSSFLKMYSLMHA